MPDHAETLTLREVADSLGVHYMTVYGYVRTGRLDAHRDGVQWRVPARAVDALAKPQSARTRTGSRSASSRLAERLLHGDEAGAWRIVEECLVGGKEPEAVHLDVVGPALASIGRRSSRGSVGIAEEHRATVVAQRIVARLGPRFARRGRSRGTVVLGCVRGERHALPSAILADLLRGRGFEAADLGADTPPDSFVAAALDTTRLIVVVVGAISPGFDTEMAAAMRGLAEAGVTAPRYVGGPGVRDLDAAHALGAEGWTGRDGRTAVRTIESLPGARR